LLLPIDVKHDDVDLLSDLEDFRGMPDSAPTHVGDMEQPVQAIEIDKRAEVGDILDGAFADVAGGHFGQQLRPALVPFLFNQLAAGKDDVLPVLIDFDDLEIVGVPHVTLQVPGRNDVDLGGRQEGLDADVDEQTAFDDGLDFAGDGAALVADG